MLPESKQDQKQHPLDASTALTIQGCRRTRWTTVQPTADKIQLTGSNRKDPTPTKHPSKPPSATCSTSHRTPTDLATRITKTPRKRWEERSEERNDYLLRIAQSVSRTSMRYSTAALTIYIFSPNTWREDHWYHLSDRIYLT
jgi:hypothetical protein